MQDKLNINSQEVALGADINGIQQILGNTLSQLLMSSLTGTPSGEYNATAAVIGGFGVTIAAPYNNYVVAPGLAIQHRATPLEAGDFNVELLTSNANINVAAAAPGVSARVDIVEMQVQARTVTNATRAIYDPSSGIAATQTVPKNVRSVPLFRVRTNVAGNTTFDPDWIPLALVEVYLDLGGNPIYTVHDCRPMHRTRIGPIPNGQVLGEIATPAADLAGGNNALICGGTVQFDGRQWNLPAPNSSTAYLLNCVEGGGVLIASPLVAQMHHLYIAKPLVNSCYSPDYVQFILSTKYPKRDGSPSTPLAMHGPVCLGLTTTNAKHIATMLLFPTLDGFGVVQPNAHMFRRAGELTLHGELNTSFEGEIGCVAATKRLKIPLLHIPPNASFVRIALHLVNESGYNSVTKIGFGYLAAAGTEMAYQKMSLALGILRLSVVVDAPVVRGADGSTPMLILLGDEDFKVKYQVLGWSTTPTAAVAEQG
jgi:hypothetical protein